MPYEAQSHHVQPLEQLMTTMFTCRSVVKYNLTLGEEQKKELLADIDTSLEDLRSYLLTDPSKPVSLQAPLPTSSSSVPDTTPSSSDISDDNEQQMLQALYKMYHAYISMNQGNNLSTFVSRFNEVMTIIQEIQQVIEHSYQANDFYVHDSSVEEPLHRVKAFIADIYYIFMEFMRVLSETLQQNNVQLDTEKLSTLQRERTIGEKLPSPNKLVALSGAYDAHQQLSQKRGAVASRVADATAFLEFLKEGLGADINQRDEVLSQLNNVVRLLHELSHLVTDYERAIAALFDSEG